MFAHAIFQFTGTKIADTVSVLALPKILSTIGDHNEIFKDPTKDFSIEKLPGPELENANLVEKEEVPLSHKDSTAKGIDDVGEKTNKQSELRQPEKVDPSPLNLAEEIIRMEQEKDHSKQLATDNMHSIDGRVEPKTGSPDIAVTPLPGDNMSSQCSLIISFNNGDIGIKIIYQSLY